MDNKIKKIINILIFSFTSFFLYRLAINHSQYLGFQDENAQMTAGMLINNRFTLYKDIYLNHQPLIYTLSSIIDKVFHPNTIFLLVKRHREIIFLMSIFWNFIFIYSFGNIFIFFFIIFESVKYLFLGNMFLGESISVYPLIYITLMTIQSLIFNKKVSIFNILLISLSIFIIIFTLAPLIPIAIIYTFIWFYILFIKDKKLLYIFILTGLFLTATLFLFWNIPPLDYYREALMNNRYHISSYNLTIFGTITKSLLLPFTVLSPNPGLIQIVLILSFIILFLQYIKLTRKQKIILFTIIFISLLSNNRVYRLAGSEYFGVFHALPWFGTILSIPFILIKKQKDTLKNRSIIITYLLIFTLIVISIIHPNSPFRNKRDVMNDNDINYSKFVTYGSVVNALKKENDRIIAFPFETLIIWQSKAKPATKLIEYYSWSYMTEEGRSDYNNVLLNNPPEFLYYESDKGENSFDALIVETMKKRYTRINHLNKPSNLYILNEKLKEITEKQWQQANYLLFSLPED